MKKILIIAGPNGAGKTTFATEFLPTLSSRSWLRLIPRWKSLGYRVKLYFLTLPDPDFALRRVERRVRFGGHDIPAATVRRRFQRGLENLRNHYRGLVDEWSIYDGSQWPPRLLDAGDNRPPDTLMEDSAEYRTHREKPRPVRPLDDPDFIGAEAALKRASAKAVARDRAAGLEPVVSNPADLPKEP